MFWKKRRGHSFYAYHTNPDALDQQAGQPRARTDGRSAGTKSKRSGRRSGPRASAHFCSPQGKTHAKRGPAFPARLAAALVAALTAGGCGGGADPGSRPASSSDFLYPTAVDTSFADGGYLDIPTGLRPVDTVNMFQTAGFIVDNRDRLVIAGMRLTQRGTREVWLYRLRSDMQPDASCNGNGWLAFDIGPTGAPRQIVQLRDGRYALPGLYSYAHLYVVREDCTLDRAFGQNGGVVFPTPRPPFEVQVGIQAAASDAEGRIVAVARGQSGRLLVARFLADGRLDPSFGNHAGIAWHAGPDYYSFLPAAIAVRADGRILVAGQAMWSEQVGFWPAFAQLTADGLPDPSFGTSGFVTAKPEPKRFGMPNAMLVLPDGSALQAGGAQTVILGMQLLKETDAYYFKVDAQGRPDPAFGRNGFVIWDAGPYPDSSSNYATALAVLPDGRVAACHDWMNVTLGEPLAVYQTLVQMIDPRDGSLVTRFFNGGTGWLPRRPSYQHAHCLGLHTSTSGELLALLDYSPRLATDTVAALVRVRR